MPNLLGVLETSLYVEEFERACPFYEQVLGLNSIYRDQRLCAYDVGARGVLLLFLRGRSLETVRLPGGTIPPHDGQRPGAHRLFDRGRRARGLGGAAQGRGHRHRRPDQDGRAAARASISAIPTGISSNWRRPVCGRGIS